jgi:hypothetical protein
MKNVNYFNKNYEVPDSYTHLAMDDDGTVYAFIGTPYITTKYDNIWIDKDGDALLVDELDMNTITIDWKDSLIKI